MISHLQSRVLIALPGHYASHHSFYFFCLCAAVTRILRADSLGHLLFSTSSRLRCIAAVCWFLLRGCVFRLDDACQKRFSWFPDWIEKVQDAVNLADLKKCLKMRQFSLSEASIHPRTSLSKFEGGVIHLSIRLLQSPTLTQTFRAPGLLMQPDLIKRSTLDAGTFPNCSEIACTHYKLSKH